MKKTKIKTAALMDFLRSACSNYDTHYKYCIARDASEIVDEKLRPVQNGERCLVQRGQPCGYFERVVLPMARKQGIHDKVSGQYCQFCRSGH